MISTGRSPEAALRALSCVFLDPATWREVSGLTFDDFPDENTRTIFAALRKLSAQGDELSLANVAELDRDAYLTFDEREKDLHPRAKVGEIAHYVERMRAETVTRQAIDELLRLAERIEKNDAKVGAEDFLRLGAFGTQLEHTKNGANGRPPTDDWRGMFHTFDEFETAAPLSFAIRGFLQNDGATMIGGLSGHGKTLINLSVAGALLAGKGQRLWNLFEVEESALRVVYLIPECAIEPFKHRLRLFRLYDYLAPRDERLLVRTLSKGPTPCLSDPRILFACKGAHVILDTAVRFSAEGDENSAGDNQRGLASDIFALLGAGARSVLAAHHSPKPFAKETVMRLENVLRGSGDIGAMLTTAWGIKQIDEAQNIIHVENIKPRDFQPCGPFQIIGRPFIDETGDFRLLKPPGECGKLAEEQEVERDRGGAPEESRKERERRIGMVREWLDENTNQTADELRERFERAGVTVSASAVKKYRQEALRRGDE